MKTIDLSLFDDEGFCIKTKENSYVIEFVSTIMELKLMQQNETIISKASKWKDLEQQDLDRWKDLIKKIIAENTPEFDEKGINSLKPMEVIAIMLGLMNYLNKRSEVIQSALDDDTKKEIAKLKEDTKKKAMKV